MGPVLAQLWPNLYWDQIWPIVEPMGALYAGPVGAQHGPDMPICNMAEQSGPIVGQKTLAHWVHIHWNITI